MIKRNEKVLKKVWNRGLKIQTNSGRTHFKKGQIPHNFGKSYYLNDLRGKKHGRLLIIEHRIGLNKRSSWLCRCECGKEKVIRSDGLKITQSCGCLQREAIRNIKTNKGWFKKGISHKWKRGLNKKGKKSKSKCVECEKELSAQHVQRCQSCLGKSRRGKGNPRWKGGYENKLWHNRQRRIKKKENGGSHTLAEWEALKMRWGWMCLCCKKVEPEITLSVDHIIPLSKGGTDNICNIQPLCRNCNSRKRSKIIDFVKNYA